MLQYLLSLLIIVIGNCQYYNFHKFQKNSGAYCLDGSLAGIYIHEGKDINKDKFLLYFNGGGYCGSSTLSDTLQDCYRRSFTDLGSTKAIPISRNFDNDGVLSTIREKNPIFYDWTKIFVIYCDGVQHQGYRQQYIQYKDQTLYFRGMNNTLETFRFLSQKYDFYNKNQIVITGVSAGGIATYFWSNYLMQHAIKAKVYAIPDSGLFLTDYYSPIVGRKALRQSIEIIMNLTNAAKYHPIPQCIKDFNGDVVQCFNVANFGKYLKAPLFMVQSVYDSWAIQYIIGVSDCLKDQSQPFSLAKCNETIRQFIEDYRIQSIQAIKLLKNQRKDVGIWSPACVKHGFVDHPDITDQNYKIPTNTGIKIFQAIEQFLQNPQKAKSYVDTEQWPINKGCSGTMMILKEQ